MTSGSPPNIRVYASVRTAHLERLAAMVPAEFVYNETRYDFDETVLRGAAAPRQMSRPAIIWHLLRRSYHIVELNEPFMVARWPDLLAQIAAVRLRARLDRRTAVITTYALSLKDPVGDAAQRRYIPRRVAPWITRRVLTSIVRQIDRIAFGTQAAHDLMVRYVPPELVATRGRVFLAVSGVCSCAERDRLVEERSPTVLFVGAFTERKGVPELMSAWTALASSRPDARLVLIGSGPLTDKVIAWAGDRPEVTVTVDPPRSEIHAAMRSARTVVMLSQRRGLWREQVGLPILEGLSHGARIVTTDETGLAGWLADHGHVVVPAASPVERYAEAIVQVLDAGPPPAEVLAGLPDVDARITADRWMFAGDDLVARFSDDDQPTAER